MLSQKDQWKYFFWSLLLNGLFISLTIFSSFFIYFTVRDFLVFMFVVYGIILGIISNDGREGNIHFLIFFVILTILFGLGNSLIITASLVLIVAMIFSIKILLKRMKFEKIIFWLGLASEEEYEKTKNEQLAGDNGDEDELIVNLSLDPKEISGFNIKHHNYGPENFRFDAENYELFLSNAQKQQETVRGSLLFNFPIIKQRGLSANLLDWLLEHPNQIPEKFKLLKVVFWGTVYEQNGLFYVRCLVYNGENFSSETHWFNQGFDEKYSAIIISENLAETT